MLLFVCQVSGQTPVSSGTPQLGNASAKTKVDSLPTSGYPELKAMDHSNSPTSKGTKSDPIETLEPKLQERSEMKKPDSGE